MNDVIKSINVDGVEYDIQAKELTKVTYAELKELRDNSGLVAGHLYRITDYEFTTKQIETKSAGHVFDIIVLAVAENELSHIARAIAHEEDTYFDGNDLGAWELWYELDNDAEKYAWADAENGKGIIYRMIDEKRNDCPYDFKNALFYNEKLTTSTTSDKYYYTFSYVVSGVLYDGTVEKQVKGCYSNSMGVTRTLLGKKEMNKNVFRNTGFSYSCNRNTFGYNCGSNTFGYNCGSNTFGDYCGSNTFGDSCNSNTFGDSCYYNTFGDSCNRNTFGDFCYSNTFGDSCDSNTFGYSCYYNTFGYNCDSNTFGSNITHHKVNSEKTSITLNDEYFDDGSGKLVPVKHPDLSTQPSILPYKFAGNYVYEQLIPTSSMAADLDDKLILSAEAAGAGKAKAVGVTCAGGVLTASEDVSGYKWLRVVYTSMPEDGGYYYEQQDDRTGFLIKMYSLRAADAPSLYNGEDWLFATSAQDAYWLYIPSDYNMNFDYGPTFIGINMTTKNFEVNKVTIDGVETPYLTGESLLSITIDESCFNRAKQELLRVEIY